jgi:large-conductance mechanosensitive channel
MKLTKGDWIIIVVFSLVLQFLSFWCIDVSVSALLMEGTVVNAFMSMSPSVTYHLGLYLSILNFAFIVFITIHHILQEKPIKKEKTVKKKKEEPKEEVSK